MSNLNCRTTLTLGVLLSLLAGACTPAVSTATPTATERGILTPYQTPDPSLRSGQAPSQTPPSPNIPVTASVTATPTATPFLHTIAANDTLLAIAFKYGVTLDNLMAANPGVDPYLLIPGKTLVIPIGGGILALAPTPTPLPVQTGAPVCYPTADGGLWCFMLAMNPHPGPPPSEEHRQGRGNGQPQALENLSAWIGLYSPEGESVAGQVAIPPLNLLPAGQSMPLVAFFPPPLPEQVVPRGALLTALAVVPDPTRYLTATVEVAQVAIAPAGLQATVTGPVRLAEDSPPAGLVWLAAVAYGEEGEVVGVRKWEAAGALASPLEFALTVFSLGPPIARVEVLVEARP